MHDTIEYLNSLGTNLKKTSSSNGGEYHGPCPYCEEGQDRFWVTIKPSGSRDSLFYCRRCRKGGKVFALAEYLGGDKSKVPRNKGTSKTQDQGKGDLQISPPPENWQNKLKRLFESNLTIGVGTEEPFRRRGISRETMTALGFGYNPKVREIEMDGKKVEFKEGMAIPLYRGDTLYSVQVRQWLDGSKYYYFSGSVAVPYHITKLDVVEAPVVIVESALDAAILYQEAGDLIHAVALGSAQKKPDSYLRLLLSMATQVFVCMDHDEAGLDAIKWWKQNYPEASIGFCPTGKDIGDYHVGGHSVRDWVKDLIDGKDFPDRPQPDFRIMRVPDSIQAEELIRQIIGNDIVPGISLSANYLALSTDEQTFVLDLNEIPTNCLATLNFISCAAHDGVQLITDLTKRGLKCKNVESTQLQFLVINGMKWDIEKLAQFRLGYGPSYYDDNELYKTALEAHICSQIFQAQHKKVCKKGLNNVYQLYAKAQSAVSEIRTTGFCFDRQKHEQLYTDWQKRLDELTPESKEYGSLNHLVNTYGKKYAGHCDPETGRILADFSYTESPTGRFTTANPNLMGVPKKEIREAFLAPEGRVLIGADYSQIDLRTGAMISMDEKMIEAFKDEVDIHRLSGVAIHQIDFDDVTEEQRNQAKEVNYASIYGGESQAVKAAKARLSKKFPQFYQWLDQQVARDLSVNQVRTPMGRVILRNSRRKEWRRQLCNYPIQGGAQEVLLAALGQLSELLEDLDADIILAIHDEIIIEAAQEDAEAAGNALATAMEQGFLEIFPDGPLNGLVKLRQGKTWAELK